MMLFNRRKMQMNKIMQAFPAECGVFNRLSLISTAYSGVIFSTEQTEWTLLSGERIKIPYRVYLREDPKVTEGLTPTQKAIYYCIYSRSNDGYVREKCIKALLETDTPQWALPYVIKVCDEYVVEILQTVYAVLKKQNCEKYRSICMLNLDNIRYGHSRMISYWNEYYRGDCYRYQNYIGKKLYRDCFGYAKTGQKNIK